MCQSLSTRAWRIPTKTYFPSDGCSAGRTQVSPPFRSVRGTNGTDGTSGTNGTRASDMVILPQSRHLPLNRRVSRIPPSSDRFCDVRRRGKLLSAPDQPRRLDKIPRGCGESTNRRALWGLTRFQKPPPRKGRPRQAQTGTFVVVFAMPKGGPRRAAWRGYEVYAAHRSGKESQYAPWHVLCPGREPSHHPEQDAVGAVPVLAQGAERRGSRERGRGTTPSRVVSTGLGCLVVPAGRLEARPLPEQVVRRAEVSLAATRARRAGLQGA